jgi:hypothetical protein
VSRVFELTVPESWLSFLLCGYEKNNVNLLAVPNHDVFLYLGEKLTDDEVNELLQGHEDSQGNVNYEGTSNVQAAVFYLLFHVQILLI